MYFDLSRYKYQTFHYKLLILPMQDVCIFKLSLRKNATISLNFINQLFFPINLLQFRRLKLH